MDVNEETQVETKKRSAWVLTYSDDGYGNQGDFIRAIYMEKPTIMDMARFFQGHPEKPRHECAMSALVFLDHLVNGGGRAVAGDAWWTLQEVTES